MSNYAIKPIDLAGLRTVSLKARGGKVRMDDFANPYTKGSGVLGLLKSLPRILAADSFRLVVESISLAPSSARRRERYSRASRIRWSDRSPSGSR